MELPIRARVAAMTAIRSVCGIEDVDILVSHTPGPPHYAATFTGWSPSLHRVNYMLHVDCDTAPDDPDFAEDLAASFEAALGDQRRRLAAGMELGIVAPMATVSDGADEVDTGSLMVDSALVAIAREKTFDPYAELLDVLAHVHGPDALHEGGPVLAAGRGTVAETPHGRVMGMSLGLSPWPGRNTVTFDGLTLDIAERDMPDTALAALAGKPLRTLVEVHPLLDDRKVFGAECIRGEDGPTVRVALEFDLVPVSSLRKDPDDDTP